MADASPIMIARFWSKVSVGDESDCWNWRAGVNNKGYGRANINGAEVKSHRFSYEFFKGPIEAGLIVRHKCDNPACCNPRHMELCSTLDNARDRVERGRHAGCTSITPGWSRLTDEQIIEIRRNPDGLTGRELALKFGVAPSTITYVRSRRSRTHLA